MTSCPEPHLLIDAAYGVSTAHDAHIASCPACQDELRMLRATLGAVSQLPAHSADHVAVRIPAKRSVPYGTIAATVLLLATFLIGIRIDYSPDGGWSIQFGVQPRTEQIAAATSTVTPDMLAAMQAEQLAAMRRMIEEVRSENDTAVESLIRDYVTLTETRRSLDYQLIRYEIEDLKERTDDQLYRSNLAMHDLLSQLSYANQTD